MTERMTEKTTKQELLLLLPEEVARQSHSGRQQCSAGEEDDPEACKSAQADPQPGYYPERVILLVQLADLAHWVPMGVLALNSEQINPKEYCAWPKVENSQLVNNSPMLNS